MPGRPRRITSWRKLSSSNAGGTSGEILQLDSYQTGIFAAQEVGKKGARALDRRFVNRGMGSWLGSSGPEEAGSF